MTIVRLFLLIFIAASCTPKSQLRLSYDEKGKIYNIPKVNITVDGNADDWNNQGTSCNLYSDYMGKVPEASDFNASFKMGWNDTAFCVMVDVKDDSLFSTPKNSVDAVELFLIDKVRGKNLVQYIFNPDFSKDSIQITTICWDHRGTRKVAGLPMTYKVAAKKTSSGYCLEALVPFSNIDLTAREGEEAGFEIMVRDADHEKDNGSYLLAWSYMKDAYVNNFASNRILLSDKAENIDCQVNSYVMDRDTAYIIAHASSVFAGKTITVQKDSTILYTGKLDMEGNLSAYSFKSPVQGITSPVAVFIDTMLAGVVDLSIANLEFEKKKIFPHESGVNLMLRKRQLNPAPANPVLFIGHSMFRFWHTFEEDMQGFTAINNAFGGSKSDQVLFYFDRLILPYKPKAIVYFEGANDFHTGVPADTFFKNVQTFALKVKESLPGTKLFILSPDVRNEFPEYNKLVKPFVMQNKDFITYIDLSDLKKNLGARYDEICLPDHTHWNSKGYSILTPIIREKIKAFKD